jgi:hypothetical protein
MITSRDELLTAIRRAEVTPTGLIIGPSVWTRGEAVRFGKVIDDETRRALLNRIKLASSRNFQPESIWELPHVRSKQNRPARAAS